jgi:DNA-binding IclR family transcriptional regulator
MKVVRALVRGGRLIVDEPTNLPEGTVLELIEDDTKLSPEEADELRAIRARGAFVTHEELRAKLAARPR